MNIQIGKADLSSLNLVGVDLHDANLTESKLIKTKLSSSNLSSAKLKGADLSGAELGSADLYSANLTGANLSGAILRGANLKGMIDFTGANLTGADLRGADLIGMVNFENAILHNVDFTGANMDNKLINFKGADFLNCRGLAPVLPSNEYVKALKSFSEDIIQEFKSNRVPPKKTRSTERRIKDIINEVTRIEEPGGISKAEKQKLYVKFVDIAKEVIQLLPKTSKTQVFSTMSPFSKLIGKEIKQIVEEILNQKVTDKGKSKPISAKKSKIKPKPPAVKLRKTPRKRFMCSVCGKEFVTEKDVRLHRSRSTTWGYRSSGFKVLKNFF